MKELKVSDDTSTRSGAQLESETIIRLGDFYIHASSQTSRRATRVLVNGESFAVFEVGGDIVQASNEPLGFFHRDTRYLSRFEFRIAGESPYHLNSYASRDNAQLRINLSNPDLGYVGEEIRLPRNSIQIERNWVIGGAALFHKVILLNYAQVPVEIPLEFLFEADFADVFEVRGFKRASHGSHLEPELAPDGLTFLYQGLDGVRRFTTVSFQSKPASLKPGHAAFVLTLGPGERKELEVRIVGACEAEGAGTLAPARFDQALKQRRTEIEHLDAGWARISTSHEPLDFLLQRSAADLTSMIRFAPEGTYLMAGIPWFASLFGRDSILTALFVLPFNPALAVGTLKTLASLQGSRVDDRREEQPGKIIHELRAGELAATGEVPFGRYYGSVDATPLFLWLLGRYVEITGDLGLPRQLWNNVERALDWIENWGDCDGDGYVEYVRETPRGLANQGWKDSFDAIAHVDGTLARPPIAVCEVQGYVYAAYNSIAAVAQRLGRDEVAGRLRQRAARLRSRFSHDFWLERERTVALALDADKRPCRVMASNAAHCLATGLLNREQAEMLADRLMADDMFTGWGLRTLSSRERRYNPMSYHNGSVWPHDNALAAAGLARFKRPRSAIRILEGLLQAAGELKTGSLPELFCGYPRDERLGPVPYPVACHPQAWSAASIFMIIQAILGIDVLALEHKLVIDSPVMPEWLGWIKIEGLKVGDGEVSLIARRVAEGTSVSIVERRGDVRIEMLK
ncbi:MAG TPA: amylo-alpha-1,6-glucosidase [Xanthobacteraceae bacterium]|nr:amylo-alpha-1,6-glucosidase [Xanthobacteraceae bacterium]